jgi:hypothetical protein
LPMETEVPRAGPSEFWGVRGLVPLGRVSRGDPEGHMATQLPRTRHESLHVPAGRVRRRRFRHRLVGVCFREI